MAVVRNEEILSSHDCWVAADPCLCADAINTAVGCR